MGTSTTRRHPPSILCATILLAAPGASDARARQGNKGAAYRGKSLTERIKQLRDPDAENRHAAIEAIGEIEPKAEAAGTPRVALLVDRESGVRLY
jgi:hypothetical protein